MSKSVESQRTIGVLLKILAVGVDEKLKLIDGAIGGEFVRYQKLVSAFVFEFVSKTLEKLTQNLRQKYENIKIVYAGGVMSNKIIQSNLKNKFEQVYFAEPEYSTDNACGTALLAYKMLKK